ncbi:serine hydrolase domain-containing protein [Thalassiella azotivora]
MARFSPVVDVLEERVSRGALPGYALAVRHAGRVHHAVGGCLDLDGGRPVRPQTPWRLASVTKLFAAVLAGSLLDSGDLDRSAPLTRWLPELTDPSVLVCRHGPLDDARPARRDATVGDLLACTPGFGGVWADCPLSQAMNEQGLSPGPFAPAVAPDEYLARLGALPLAAQPGAAWLYHTSSDVLGVLLSRSTGCTVGELLDERVLRPLGLRSVAFHTDPSALGPSYQPEGGAFTVMDPADGVFARPPAFESLAAGLVATADDVLTLLRAVADGGGQVLTPGTARLLAQPSTDPGVTGDGGGTLDAGLAWALHNGVVVGDDVPGRRPGSFGWDGGTGTTAWADPSRDLVGVVLSARGYGDDEDDVWALWPLLARCADGSR